MTEAAVICIPLPNLFFEGATNVYALPGDPLTLIDTGIGTDEAWIALRKGLQAHGLVPEAVRQVVLTHHHLDHFGLAYRLRETCGARVFVHADDWEAVDQFGPWYERFITRVGESLRAWGTPRPEIQAVFPLLQVGAKLLGRSTPAEPLADGERLPAGSGELEVLHTPGHTQGSICLRYGRCLFSGDHVLPDISPNIGADLGAPGLLGRYLASLRRVMALQTTDLRVYPGHGAPFTDLAGRVEELLAHHHTREEAIVEVLRTREAQTVYQAAVNLFGPLRDFHVVLGTAEVYAHLEKLAGEGRVVLQADRYRAA
jgi:glyoxylase-like metal-dependent hydrolase (beta-lactamase superfamily II)